MSTCNECKADNGILGTIIGGDLLKPKGVYSFVDGQDTKVVLTEIDGITQVRYDYAPYRAPSVSLGVSPTVFEVGDTVPIATFTLNITERSNPLSSIVINPDPGIVPTVGTNTFQVLDVTRDTAGSIATHTATITDDSGNGSISDSASLSARWRYFQGFSLKSTLNETDIKALVNQTISTGIKTVYGGSKNYVVPASAVNQYVYWAFPNDTSPFTSLSNGAFAVPFISLGDVSVTNDFGVTKLYTVVRTAVALGSGTVNIVMN